MLSTEQKSQPSELPCFRNAANQFTWLQGPTRGFFYPPSRVKSCAPCLLLVWILLKVTLNNNPIDLALKIQGRACSNCPDVMQRTYFYHNRCEGDQLFLVFFLLPGVRMVLLTHIGDFCSIFSWPFNTAMDSASSSAPLCSQNLGSGVHNTAV